MYSRDEANGPVRYEEFKTYDTRVFGTMPKPVPPCWPRLNVQKNWGSMLIYFQIMFIQMHVVQENLQYR